MAVLIVPLMTTILNLYVGILNEAKFGIVPFCS